MPACIRLKGDEGRRFWKRVPRISLVACVLLEAGGVLLHAEEGKRPRWDWRGIDRVNGVLELVSPPRKLGWAFVILVLNNC